MKIDKRIIEYGKKTAVGLLVGLIIGTGNAYSQSLIHRKYIQTKNAFVFSADRISATDYLHKVLIIPDHKVSLDYLMEVDPKGINYKVEDVRTGLKNIINFIQNSDEFEKREKARVLKFYQGMLKETNKTHPDSAYCSSIKILNDGLKNNNFLESNADNLYDEEGNCRIEPGLYTFIAKNKEHNESVPFVVKINSFKAEGSKNQKQKEQPNKEKAEREKPKKKRELKQKKLKQRRIRFELGPDFNSNKKSGLETFLGFNFKDKFFPGIYGRYTFDGEYPENEISSTTTERQREFLGAGIYKFRKDEVTENLQSKLIPVEAGVQFKGKIIGNLEFALGYGFTLQKIKELKDGKSTIWHERNKTLLGTEKTITNTLSRTKKNKIIPKASAGLQYNLTKNLSLGVSGSYQPKKKFTGRAGLRIGLR